MSDITDVAEPIITRLSRSLAAEHNWIEADDIGQEMRLHVFRQEASIFDKPREDWEKLITFRARQAGSDYVYRERRDYQHQTQQWIYTPTDVRAILATSYYDAASWEDAPKRPSVGTQTLTSDGVSILLMDMTDAMDSLPEQDQSVLVAKYRQGADLSAADQKRSERAIDRLCDYLNRAVSMRFDHDEYSGPGSRTAVSNAVAQAMTHDTY